MNDPQHAIILGDRDPNHILPGYAKVVGGGVVKLAKIPLNYLRFHSKNPLSDVQYAAAQHFISVFSADGGGSNTAAVCETAARLALPDDKKRSEKARIKQIEAAGRQIMARADSQRIMCDPESRLLAEIDRQRSVRAALRPREISVLYDLLVEDKPVPHIALRWGVDRTVVSAWIREALLVLAKHLAKHDRRFNEIIAEYKTMEDQE